MNPIAAFFELLLLPFESKIGGGIFAACVIGGLFIGFLTTLGPKDPVMETKRVLNSYPAEGAVDGWGNPIKVVEKKGMMWDTWSWTSAGPDQVMDTGDDMIKKRRIRR